MTIVKRSISAVKPHPDTLRPCLTLAEVARRRADEQTRLASAAEDEADAAPHLEQKAHLIGLAETYERLASRMRSADP